MSAAETVAALVFVKDLQGADNDCSMNATPCKMNPAIDDSRVCTQQLKTGRAD
jgi:hypothetical protein